MKSQNLSGGTFRMNGKRMHFKILSIDRSDPYGGPCEPVARKLGINPEICICDEDAVEVMAEELAEMKSKPPVG